MCLCPFFNIIKMIDVPFDSKKRLIDIMLDNPTLVKGKNNEWLVKDLRTYSRVKIAEVFNKIEQTGITVSEIILKEAMNLKYSAEIVAIILLNHTFTPDENDNQERIKKMTTKVLLETTDETDWIGIVLQAVNGLNVEAVFQISLLGKALISSVTTRKKVIAEQLQSMQPQ